jgi:hypothetical protein
METLRETFHVRYHSPVWLIQAFPRVHKRKTIIIQLHSTSNKRRSFSLARGPLTRTQQTTVVTSVHGTKNPTPGRSTSLERAVDDIGAALTRAHWRCE